MEEHSWMMVLLWFYDDVNRAGTQTCAERHPAAADQETCDGSRL